MGKTVCAACLQESCAKGELYCENYLWAAMIEVNDPDVNYGGER